MNAETLEGARQLSGILIRSDRADLRQWIEWALGWYVRNRAMALAAAEAELSQDKPSEPLRTYLDQLEPWVETWPADQRPEARMRFELCRVQMHNYMWGKSHALFPGLDLPVDLFTEIWWNTLKAPLLAPRP
jgi:hypothetical protein